MLWSRSSTSTSTSAAQVPAASVSPERTEGRRVPEQLRAEAFSLIDVLALKGGLWRAVCECGEAPHVFTHEHAAWGWISEHTCPVLEADTCAV